MKVLLLVLLILSISVNGLAPAVLGRSKKQNHYIIDGNNLLHSKGVPREAEILTEKIRPIAAADPVILVFDGRPGVERSEIEEGNFRKIQLGEGMSSDDFILDQITSIGADSKENRVKLVTADKRLRSKALSKGRVVKSVVNPITFWKKHRPRMAGFKSTYTGFETSDEE
eukprot:scaffold683_cov124-Cylindrotheca_fusiformis.AAC.35